MEQNKTPKLVQNRKVEKLPRMSGSVAGTFRRAQDIANKDGANKVIIISVDPGGIQICCSNVSMYDAIGILERGKMMLTRDKW